MNGDDEESVSNELFQSASTAYGEMLEVMAHAAKRLNLVWEREKQKAARSRLDECYLSGHHPSLKSLPFLPDLHAELERLWVNPYSARLHPFQLVDYANVEGLTEHGYVRMPPVKKMLMSHLS